MFFMLAQICSFVSLKLAIDAGNTRIKWALLKPEGHFDVLISGSLAEVRQALPFKPDAGNTILADVRHNAVGNSSDFPEACRLHGTDALLPLGIVYQTPETLGADRLANAAALHHLYPGKNALCVDLGTCIKFDFKNSRDQYEGGSISPGLSMRYAALEQGTGLLPLLKPQATGTLLGKSSQSSIHAGTFGGWRTEINSFLEQWNLLYPDLSIIFTGGDCSYLDNDLLQKYPFDADLTLKGLFHIMKFRFPTATS